MSMFPRQQHYQFAYSALPSTFFNYEEFPKKIRFYPVEFINWFQYLWFRLAEVLPPEEHSPIDGLGLSAHLMDDSHLVLIVKMPPPERPVEVFLIALVISHELRYFTLGKGVGISPKYMDTTFREVTREGVNRRVAGGRADDESELLRLLSKEMGLAEKSIELSSEQVQSMYSKIFRNATFESNHLLNIDTSENSSKFTARKKPWWKVW